MEALFQALLDHGNGLLAFATDAGKRIYGVYLLGALVMVALASVWQLRQCQGRAPWRALLSPRIWWHPSARLDYGLFLINPFVRGLLLGAVGLSLVPVALATSNWLDGWLVPPAWGWSRFQVSLAFTLALFLADDFSRFLLHWLMHKVPALWSIHRLHHSAEVLTPITVYRIHPLESLLYSLRMVVAQGLVLGLFFFGFGMRLSAFEIAGANLFTYLFNLAGANLRHSHVWISYGPWLERLFISPAQHQIHHSSDPAHFDRNMGAFLALWDGLFGTLQLARGQRVTGFGLSRGSPSPHPSLWRAYLEPPAHALAWTGRAIRRVWINTSENDLQMRRT